MEAPLSDHSSVRVLHTPEDLLPWRSLRNRLLIILALLISVITILWLDRDGLRDHADDQISFVDVLYFGVITITTVGYGDFTPRAVPLFRLITCAEAFSGPFMAGLYIFTLTRRYAAG